MSGVRQFARDVRAALGTTWAFIWALALVLNSLGAIRSAAIGRWDHAISQAVIASFAYWVMDARVERYRCPLHHSPLGPRQAIVSAPVEPSSDARAWARGMADVRAALIAAGYTPEQASRQLGDVTAALVRGEQ